MKNKKYVSNGGLAFGEKKEMKKLSKLAKQGWIFEGFAWGGTYYKLRRGESQNVDFAIDYNSAADDEYFAIFEEAGWKRITSSYDMHVFQAPEGTTPIYSDKVTTMEKYEREKKLMGKAAFPTLIITVLFFSLEFMSNKGWMPEVIGTIGLFLGFISAIGLVFSGMPYLAITYKLIKLRRKQHLDL